MSAILSRAQYVKYLHQWPPGAVPYRQVVVGLSNWQQSIFLTSDDLVDTMKRKYNFDEIFVIANENFVKMTTFLFRSICLRHEAETSSWTKQKTTMSSFDK